MTETFNNLDELSQWVWTNRDDPNNPCDNYARYGQWVATEYDGGGTASVHLFPTESLAKTFVHMVRHNDERQRLRAWDMTSFYESWDSEDDQLADTFPFTINQPTTN